MEGLSPELEVVPQESGTVEMLPVRHVEVAWTTWLGLAAAFAIFFAVLEWLPLGSQLDTHQRATLAVTLWACTVWITGALPKAISGLSIPVLLYLSGATSKSVAFAGFTSNTSLLVIGSFLIASALNARHLDRRIALTIMSWAKPKLSSFLKTYILAQTATAVIIPAIVARAAIFLPIVQGTNALLEPGDKGHRARQAMTMSAVGFAAVFAGPLFLTGSMPNVIVAHQLNHQAGAHIYWFQWFWLNLPLAGLIPIMYFWTLRHFKIHDVGLRHGPETIVTERAKLGPLNLTDKLSLGVVALAVVLWATGHWTHLSTGLVAVGAACLLFLPGLLSGYWQRIERHMMWGVWLLLGGAVCMSNAFTVTKTNVWLSHQLQHFFPTADWLVLFVLAVVTMQVLRIGIVSNVGSIALFTPIIVTLAMTLHLNPVSFSMGVLNVDSYALLIPLEIEACLVAYASGEFTFGEFFRAGAPLTAIAILYMIVVMIPWWALIGYPIWQP
ncbi:SLC13 family permease [Sulfobacillus thermosulfidooxidans]|uniref:SLC13 family permease n=1 Tax=Sulfobacillus thermosulfidooxidans TaxID=28034 RepID=UPI0006B55E10|nr:SLC13 family permease [Sulfobacillus thermosulfidooxidans]